MGGTPLMMLKLVLLSIMLLHKNPLAYEENITAYVVLAAEQVGSPPPVRGISKWEVVG